MGIKGLCRSHTAMGRVALKPFFSRLSSRSDRAELGARSIKNEQAEYFVLVPTRNMKQGTTSLQQLGTLLSCSSVIWAIMLGAKRSDRDSNLLVK
eukprot:scaffold5398_cov70-Skeletonema_marinoi.AAC.1